jgi:alkylhydroperoxidase family enzyme
MVEEDWQPLRDLGFDDVGIMDVVHVVGIFNYLTRMADGLGLQLDPATEAAGQSGTALSRG